MTIIMIVIDCCECVLLDDNKILIDICIIDID